VGRVKPRQNVAQFDRVFRGHAARVVVLVKAFQSLVADILYHLEL
jgi:hypothetical protein